MRLAKFPELTREQQELVEQNQKLIHWGIWKWARRLHRKHPLYPEMFLECQIKLCQAATRFDPSKGFTFSTYATYWVRAGISWFWRQRYAQKRKAKVQSLNYTYQGEERQTDPEDTREPNTVRKIEVQELKNKCRKLLDPREWQILVWRYEEGMILEEVGQKLGGISRERVRQLEEPTIEKLNRRFPQGQVLIEDIGM